MIFFSGSPIIKRYILLNRKIKCRTARQTRPGDSPTNCVKTDIVEQGNFAQFANMMVYKGSRCHGVIAFAEQSRVDCGNRS